MMGMIGYLLAMDFVEPIAAQRFWANNKQMREEHIFPDVCDWCSKEPVDGELKRCSKCVFARYCSKEHQLAAWKEAGGTEDSEPHKDVCVDARKAGWIAQN